MEEDNDEITGWDDNEDKILNAKITKKHQKKMTQSIVIDEELIQRKLKPSRTLPFIKNRPTVDGCQSDPTEKKSPIPIEKLHRALEERISKVNKAIKLKQYLDSLENVNTSQMTTKTQQKSHQDLRQPKQSQHEVNISIQKKLGQVKHGSTIVKSQKIPEKISYIEKLKIQACDYKSTPRNTSPTEAQKNEMLKKISKNSLANLHKKEKNKYFIVKRQKLSPEKQSEEVSKMAIESRKSSDEQIISEAKDRKTYLMKEKYCDVIKTIQTDKKKPVLMKCQSQQLRHGAHMRKNTEGQILKSTHKNNHKIRACKQASFDGYVGLKESDLVHNKKLSKWDQVLKQVENEAKTLKKLKEHQKQMFKAAKQQTTTLLPNFNQKVQMLEMMVTKRLRNDILKADQVMLSTLKKTLIKELSQAEHYRKEKTLKTEDKLVKYDEFSDECLFYNKQSN